MPKAVKRTIRILARRADGREQRSGVFAPVLAANLRMIDRRLGKAGLTELHGFFPADEERWADRDDAIAAFHAAWRHFEDHPEAIPFSDFLARTLGGIREALVATPEGARLHFAFVEVGHAGLDHGSPVDLEA